MSRRWLKLSHKLTRALYSAFGINFYEDKHLFGREKFTMKGKMNAALQLVTFQCFLYCLLP